MAEHAACRVLEVVLGYWHALVVVRENQQLTAVQLTRAGHRLGLARGVRPAHTGLRRVVVLRGCCDGKREKHGRRRAHEGAAEGIETRYGPDGREPHDSSWLNSPARFVASSTA